MAPKRKGEPRPNVRAIELKCSMIQALPGQVWYESENYFSLWDRFGRVRQPLLKTRIVKVHSKEGGS